MKKEVKPNPVVDTLKATGPTLSSVLCRELQENYGLSYEAARQRISRAQGEVNRLNGLPFPNNARFTYLRSQYNTRTYHQNLLRAIMQSGSAYSYAVNALIARNGIIPLQHFPIVCGSPIRQKKHLSHDKILTRLLEVNVLKQVSVEGVGDCIQLAINNNKEPDRNQLRARIITEEITLKAIRDWIRNLGLASYNKIKIRSDGKGLPQMGTFAWDLSGPSYLSPLLVWSKGDKPKLSPGFIVCDIVAGATLTENGFSSFLHKFETSRVNRCLYIILADAFTRDTLKKAKAKGIIPATTENLFGTHVAEGLKQLTSLLQNVAGQVHDPIAVGEIFKKLGAIEGAAINLRGVLFEFIAAELARKTSHLDSPQDIALNRIYQIAKDNEQKKSEVDVTAVTNNKIVHFIECKGYQQANSVNEEDVKDWLSRKIPIVREFALQHPDWKSCDLHFHFWTTSQFDEKALCLLKKAKSGTRRYTVDYLDSSGLKEAAKKTRDKNLIETLEKYFLEHPLAVIERKAERRQKKEAQAKERNRNIIHI